MPNHPCKAHPADIESLFAKNGYKPGSHMALFGIEDGCFAIVASKSRESLHNLYF